MTINQELEQLLKDATCGNDDAFKFLVGWNYLCHKIDDIVDGDADPRDPEFIVGLFVYAKDVYSTPFYQRNTSDLSSLVDVIFSAYTDSVHYEKMEGWQSAIGDVIRSQAVDMISYVARICGGYEHMRVISARARALSQKQQRES